MTSALRLIEGGTASGRWQVATGAALVAEHVAGTAPDTLRTFRSPPTVLVGRHQATWDTIHMEACLADSVEVARRITGGGAVLLDRGSIGWEVMIARNRLPGVDLKAAIMDVATAARAGLARHFGADAFPTGSVSGLFEGNTLAVQGFLRFAAPEMPENEYLASASADEQSQPLPETEIEITQLLAGLAEGIALRFDLMPEAGSLTEHEMAKAQRHFEDDIGTDEFVFAIDDPVETGLRIATHKSGESTTTVYLRTIWQDGIQRIAEATIVGDFIVCPARRVADLERAIEGQPVTEAPAIIDRFFAGLDTDLALITAEDFKAAIAEAIAATPRKDLMPIR
ncbi:MAG: hypothetical protein RL291_1894 [Pseudomonadota bacterium]